VSASDPAVLSERIGAVCRLTLNRPRQHNPLTPRCIDELLAAVAGAGQDPDVRAVIIRSLTSPPSLNPCRADAEYSFIVAVMKAVVHVP